MENKIAVYGGAFDPPQLAHESIAKEIVRKLGLKKLYIVPSGSHNFKTFGTGIQARRQMSEILAHSVGSEKIELCTVFLDGKLINTTLNTDKYFKELLGFSPYQIFGSDTINSMWQWDPSGEVALKLPKIFIKRPGYEMDYSKVANFIVLDPLKNLSIGELSSSQVRENIKKRVFDGMNPEIADFIKLNNLYV